MNPTQFLKEIQTIPTGTGNAGGGDGFKRAMSTPLLDSLQTTAGLTLTAGTTPVIATFETNFVGVQVAASTTTLGMLTILLPPDYDGASTGINASGNPNPGAGDYLAVKFHSQTSGTTNTGVTITGTAYYKRNGKALSAQLTSNVLTGAALLNYPNTVPISTAQSSTQWVDFSGNALQAGDSVEFTFVTSAHTTDAVNVYGLEVEYKSNLVYSDMSRRASF